MKFFLFSILIAFFSLTSLSAQEMDLFNIDINNLDSIFDEPLEQTHVEQSSSEPGVQTSILQDIRKRGVEFIASYYFRGAINPGWDILPWDSKDGKHFSWAIGVETGATIELNAQITESFRVKSTVSFQIPGFNFNLGDFFLDYNFFNRVFLRAGKFEQGWGISPNFGFTNLLSRIAIQQETPSNGPSYILKLDVPIGLGGLQLLTLTRVNLAGGDKPALKYFGFGGKYNLAFRWADFNLGIYYQDYMATRLFLSAKTSVWNIDIYNEWLFAINTHTDKTFKFSVNLGFSRSFFKEKLELNAEFFYNGEENTSFYRPESEFREEDSIPFIKGINFALNLRYKFDVKTNPRIFARFLYGDESFSIVPGVSITPFTNVEIYFAIPIAFGKKDGYYYQNAVNIRNQHSPFSFLLYVSFNGSVRASKYF